MLGTVLAIEDNPEVARLYAEALRAAAEPFDVTSVSSARAGLRYLDQHAVDCVLLDYQLPDRDGLEVLETIRANRPDLPVVIVTGSGSEEVAVQAMKLGAADYLVKHGGYLPRLCLAVRNAVMARAANRVAPWQGVFRREGEFWTIALGDSICRLKDIRGLHYLANLISHAGDLRYVGDVLHEVACRSRAGAEAMLLNQRSADTGLDRKARSDYQRRVTELRVVVAEAEQRNDPLLAARAGEEIELICAELSRSIGLGGRDRRCGSSTDRMRLRVTKGVKGALAKVRTALPRLGRHLTLHVKTGYLCGYLPDDDPPISWTL